ncbi:MAG: hypothetical protein AVDCRST_MAG30-1643, partial [uncultured Solirubrobacteraceae bacterium]
GHGRPVAARPLRRRRDERDAGDRGPRPHRPRRQPVGVRGGQAARSRPFPEGL